MMCREELIEHFNIDCSHNLKRSGQDAMVCSAVVLQSLDRGTLGKG